MGRLGAAELSVNGAWHSIYPFDAEKQNVSRKGKITVHPPHSSSISSPDLICVAQAVKQWPHLAGHGAQNGTTRGLPLGPMLMRMLIGGLGRESCVEGESAQAQPPCQAARA